MIIGQVVFLSTRNILIANYLTQCKLMKALQLNPFIEEAQQLLTFFSAKVVKATWYDNVSPPKVMQHH